MTARRLLYLNTHRLSAYAWRQGKLLPEATFDTDNAGLDGFAEYLQNQRCSQFSLLANVAEEGHVLETIPYLQGRDRQALISRKTGQHFLGTQLATTVSLGYEKAKRKNEKLLISALTNPAHFEPWLTRINDAAAPLAGIYTVAQLGGQLLKKLGHSTPRCLLLTLQDHSIRESFLVEGQTLFSRMAPLTDSSIAGIASSLSAEAGKLHQYLVGQRHVGRDEKLPVFIIAHPQAIPAIENACPEHGQLSFSLIDSHAAARKIGLHTLPEDSRSDLLFLHLLATAAPRQQFARATHRHDFRLAQIRQSIVAVGLLALLASGLFAAKEIYRAHMLHDESQALNAAPNISLDGIEWKIGRSSPSTAANIVGDDEITTVRGTIRPEPNATTRQVLATFEQFVERLRRDPANSINVLQQPFDMESGRPLRGGDSEGENSQPRPFAVEIMRKITP